MVVEKAKQNKPPLCFKVSKMSLNTAIKGKVIKKKNEQKTKNQACLEEFLKKVIFNLRQENNFTFF